MKKIYIVCWGSAGQDDDGNSSAYSGVAGAYLFKDDAQKGLEAYKDECYNELLNYPDMDEEDREALKKDISIMGSVNDDFFEIDYTLGDVPCQLYIRIVEQEIKE